MTTKIPRGVELLEVDFSFHEDSHKVKDIYDWSDVTQPWGILYWKLPSTQIYEQKNIKEVKGN